MVPTFTRVTLMLIGLIEDKVNVGESRINLTHIISEATLDIIGLVGEKIKKIFSSMLMFHILLFIILIF